MYDLQTADVFQFVLKFRLDPTHIQLAVYLNPTEYTVFDEFLIDTSQKKIRPRVPVCRVSACSTNLGFSVWPKHGVPLPV